MTQKSRSQSPSTRSVAGTPGSAAPLRIVVVDDHPIVRKGLADIINQEPGMTVCGEADTAEQGLARIRQHRPDVAIVDLTLGADSGLGIIKALNASDPHIRVLVLSMHDEMLHAERALAAGAHGYVMKDEAMKSLLGAIRHVASGGTYVSSRLSERIVARVTGRAKVQVEAGPFDRLTDREREVLTLVGRGMATREIARQLDLSVKTIETYQARIKDKLGLANARELTLAAATWGQS